jgi:hypothetical protein
VGTLHVLDGVKPGIISDGAILVIYFEARLSIECLEIIDG